MAQVKTETRRERSRRELSQQIKDVARRHMAEDGTAALSLRAIAREIGVTAPALYRYFPRRDDLVTQLIVDGYTELGDAIALAFRQHPADDPAGQLVQGALAYRRWGLNHPAEFALIFGTPIPGYQAPRDVTVPVARRAFSPFGLLMRNRGGGAGNGTRLNLAFFTGVTPDDLDAIAASRFDEPMWWESSDQRGALQQALEVWGRIHGPVSLEVFGHLDGWVPDRDLVFQQIMVKMAHDLGLISPSAQSSTS